MSSRSCCFIVSSGTKASVSVGFPFHVELHLLGCLASPASLFSLTRLASVLLASQDGGTPVLSVTKHLALVAA